MSSVCESGLDLGFNSVKLSAEVEVKVRIGVGRLGTDSGIAREVEGDDLIGGLGLVVVAIPRSANEFAGSAERYD